MSTAERRLALLEGIAADLAGSLHEEEIAQRAVGCLHDMLGASAAFFYVGGEDGREMRLTAHRGLSAMECAELATLPLDGRLPLAAALNEGRPRWMESCDELIARYPSARAGSPERLRALLVLPLLLDRRLLGKMAFGFDAGRAFDAADRRVLEAVAGQCALALDRARLHALERAAWGEADAERAKLYSLFMHAPAFIFVLHGPEHRIDFVNARFAELVGRPREALVGRTLREALPEYVEQYLSICDGVYRSGQAFIGREVATEVTFEGGHASRYFNFVHEPMRDAAGQVIGVMSFGFEVTDQLLARRQVEATNTELEVTEERLRLALANGAIGTWDFTPPNGLLTWDQRCKELFGLLTDAEINYDLFLAGVHPDDRERSDAAVEVALDPRSSGAYDVEYRTIGFDDGVVRWVHATGRALFEGGRATRFIGIIQDISDHKKAEATRAELLEQHRRAVEQQRGLAEAALAINSASGVETCLSIITERARAIIGAHQAVTSMTVDQNWSQAISAVSLSEKYAAWQGYATKPDGSGIYAEVCRTNRPMRLSQGELTQHPLWRGFGAEASRHPPMRGWLAAPLVGRDGSNLGLLQLSDKLEGEFTARDEDILVQLAQMASVAVENSRLFDAVQSEKQRAERASRAKDEFLAMLGHELRNPLSPILTALHLARMRGTDALLRERLVIERQVQHLIRLVDDLLDVSRITRGKIALKRQPVRVAAVVARAIETASPLLEERQHRLRVEVPDDGLWVHGDEDRLSQVMANLLTNAAKYTDRGGAIDVAAAREGEEVVLRVRDSGMGIAPELLPRIFDLFIQGERALDRSQGGLGLGLSIVRSLVEQHGGRVSAASGGPGKGSELCVRLPLLAVDAAPSAPSLAAAPAVAPSPAPERARRVLVVDDNRDAAELLAEALCTVGHDARVAFNGPEAIDLARQLIPEIAFLDIGLPVMDGYELARRLRALPGCAAMYLVAVTGYGQSTDRQRSREAGFEDHLVKPVELEEVHRIITRL